MVALVAIRMEPAREPFQKPLCMFCLAVGLILIQHVGILCVSTGAVKPHIRLAGSGFVLLPQHLQCSLIPHEAPDAGAAVGAAHRKWGSTSSQWHGATSWTWSAGSTSFPCVQILAPVGTVESTSHISGWQYGQWQTGMQSSLAAQRVLWMRTPRPSRRSLAHSSCRHRCIRLYSAQNHWVGRPFSFPVPGC